MMSKLFKPMLAAKPDPSELDTCLAALRYPVLASPKLDGIRATVQNGRLYARSLKLIPNAAMQALWGREELDGLDGEIIVGTPTAEDCFNRTTSLVMSRDRPAADAVFWVFDMFGPEPFYMRNDTTNDVVDGTCFGQTLRHVRHELIEDVKQLAKYEGKMLKAGHEGVCIRSEDGKYKEGRSTLREGGLVAVKRFVDAEAVILGTYEQEENTNEKTINELGRSKRSTHKAGKRGKGTLGGFTVAMYEDTKDSTIDWHGAFHIGTGVGLTDAVRAALWKKRDGLAGKVVKFRYQKVGTKDAPRQPIFLGFRDGRDL